MVLVRFPLMVCVVAVFVLALSSQALAQELSVRDQKVDQAESLVDFTLKGSAMLVPITREGRFTEFSGNVSYDAAQPGRSHVNLKVYTASVDVRDAEQNELLRSREFFDADRFPTMEFASSSTAVRPDGTLSMSGDMTIRGITRRMTIPVTIRPAARGGNTSGAVFETTFHIDRTQFGLNGVPKWNGLKVSIARDVQIHIAIAASPAPPLAR